MSELEKLRWTLSAALAFFAVGLVAAHLFPSLRAASYKDPDELVMAAVFMLLAILLKPGA